MCYVLPLPVSQVKVQSVVRDVDDDSTRGRCDGSHRQPAFRLLSLSDIVDLFGCQAFHSRGSIVVFHNSVSDPEQKGTSSWVVMENVQVLLITLIILAIIIINIVIIALGLIVFKR